MPVAVLMCRPMPPLQNKMIVKSSRKKMATPVLVPAPENKMVKLADEDDSITVTYTLKLTKDKIVDDEVNPQWREACWAALLAMRNLDDEVVIRPSENLNESFKDFGKTDSATVNMCIMAEALTQAMLNPVYKKLISQT